MYYAKISHSSSKLRSNARQNSENRKRITDPNMTFDSFARQAQLPLQAATQHKEASDRGERWVWGGYIHVAIYYIRTKSDIVRISTAG